MSVPEGSGGAVEEVEELLLDWRGVVEEDVEDEVKEGGDEVGGTIILEEDVGVGVGVEVTTGASPQRPYCG